MLPTRHHRVTQAAEWDRTTVRMPPDLAEAIREQVILEDCGLNRHILMLLGLGLQAYTALKEGRTPDLALPPP